MGLRGVVVLGRLVTFLVVTVSSCLGCEGRKGCHDDEQRALLEIKKVFNSRNSGYLLDWGNSTTKEGKDCCQWSGITCNPNTGHVVEINLLRVSWSDVETWHPNLTMLAVFGQLEMLDLGYNNIGGGIPEVICDLKLLKTLSLSRNNFEGSIPSCLCTLGSLRKLDLSWNTFLNGSIPSCLCTLRSLITLDLSHNNLGGDIPSCFGNFQFLTHLCLSHNELRWNHSTWLCNMHSLIDLSLWSGMGPSNIPSCLGNLNKLNYLSLRGDGLNGSIPSSIFSNLTELTDLYIQGGALEGTFQFSVLASLSKLEYVTIISSNGGLEIDTEYPISWVPSFQLRSLNIDGCVVNNHSANRFPSFIWAQERLNNLILRDTSIRGTLPIDLLCNSTLSSLDLSSNKFFGPFLLPCHNSSQNLQVINLSFNNISGSLPKNIGLYFPMLKHFIMVGNKLEGQIPVSLGRTPLYFLDLSDNNLLGKLPHTLTRNQTKLWHLNVSYNHLEGEMLPFDANMPYLRYLIINNNNFIGSLLSRLSNFSDIELIDAGHNSFTDNLSHNLPYFPKMILLSLRENRIQGELSRQLCQMQHLQFLDLSENKLSGKLLPCFHNISTWRSTSTKEVTLWIDIGRSVLFKSKNGLHSYEGVPLSQMTHLDLSMNKISGIIPQEIGKLKGLRSLNLSKNHIQGFLPVAIASMDTLESLDLSYNSLSGSIPNEMVRLSFLSTFSVAFNNLTGMIPNGIQFRTFPKNYFEGNPGLCGLPLEKVCSSHNEGMEEMTRGGAKKYDDALFFSFVIVSFSLGFWGFIVNLFFNMSWRMKYFKFIDQYYITCI